MKYSGFPLILNTWPDVFAKLVKLETAEVVAAGVEVVAEDVATPTFVVVTKVVAEEAELAAEVLVSLIITYVSSLQDG